jgi:hypothetical protein
MSGAPTHLLFECATGAAIFECLQTEEIGNKTKQVQESIKDLNTFGRMVRLISFAPFKNALEALQGCLDVSEGENILAYDICVVSAHLTDFTDRKASSMSTSNRSSLSILLLLARRSRA